MARHSYKLALRAKGIKPIPSHEKLRSYRLGDTHISLVDRRPRKKRA